MPKKAIVLRHMQERRDDHVAQFLDANEIDQLHVNPASGIPLPDNFQKYDALVIYGGVQSANDNEENEQAYIEDELKWLTKWLESGRPTLGLCLGSQLIAKCLGAEVGPHPDGVVEVGFAKVTPTSEANSFLNLPMHFYQWHGEGFTLPDNCTLLARGETFQNQAFCFNSNTYGVQFHPEVTRTIMQEWQTHGCEYLNLTGAHSAERQLNDETQHGHKMAEWCNRFMQNWCNSW